MDCGAAACKEACEHTNEHYHSENTQKAIDEKEGTSPTPKTVFERERVNTQATRQQHAARNSATGETDAEYMDRMMQLWRAHAPARTRTSEG